MPNADDLVPKLPDRCAVCGRALGDRWWHDRETGGRHEECIDWARRPSPLEPLLRRMRRLRRRLAGAVRAVDLAGRAIGAVRRRWPQAALEGLTVMRAELARLERRLRELGLDVRW